MIIKKLLSFIVKLFWMLYLPLLAFLQGMELCLYHSSREIIDTMISLPALFALYAYIFKKKILVVEIWRVYFFVFLTWHIYRNIVLEWISKTIEIFQLSFDIEFVFFYLILFCPLYFALYKVAFSKESPLLKNEKEKD